MGPGRHEQRVVPAQRVDELLLQGRLMRRARSKGARQPLLGVLDEPHQVGDGAARHLATRRRDQLRGDAVAVVPVLGSDELPDVRGEDERRRGVGAAPIARALHCQIAAVTTSNTVQEDCRPPARSRNSALTRSM